MQKITVTFVYGLDELRKLRYRLNVDQTLKYAIMKLINFQFLMDSRDYKTYQIFAAGKECPSLDESFAHYGITDGDNIFITPTVTSKVQNKA